MANGWGIVIEFHPVVAWATFLGEVIMAGESISNNVLSMVTSGLHKLTLMSYET